MKVYAAVDLRGGRAVQLVGGEPGSERVSLPDPAAAARRWLDAGFRRLHVVDLDAALGTGANDEALAGIAREVAGRGELQLGGGIRDEAAVARALDLGARTVVVGTRAVEDAEWLAATAKRWPGRLVVAADVRAGRVLTRGWRSASELEVEPFLATLDPLPVAGVLVTDVEREGREAGVAAEPFRRLASATRHPVLAAGGVTTAEDLRALAAAGAAGAVLGMALYTGRIAAADAVSWELQHEGDGWRR